MAEINPIPFGKRLLGPGHPVVIIAEIGINHEGSVDACALLIEAAVRAGADAVKLQSADPDEHYMPGTESHNLYTRAVLTREHTAAMFALAEKLGVEMLTSCGDPPTMDFIETLSPAAHKISSGMLGHLPMIRRFAASGRPLLFSSGMSDLEGIDSAISAARNHGAQHMAIMQCASLYPAMPEVMNLRAMHTFEQRYQIPAGLSDHTLGNEVATLSVAAGAHVIEKHFTLDSRRPGFDHGISLEPNGLQSLVQAVRRVEQILGSGVKVMSDAEDVVRRKYVRRVVARNAIPAGKVIEEKDLSIMRTPPEAGGLPSTHFDNVVGRVARRAFARFDLLSSDDLN
jgi:N,N'-diacetyllegionaminate synthase